MAEPIEGMIAGVFSYTPDSETEIDFEFEGRDPGVLHAVTWRTVHTKEHTAHTSGQPMSGRWLRLRYDWSSTGVSFYVNGALVAEHRRIVPERPAYLMFNVWPTNDPAWGGVSTNGTGRMWVDWVRFTPEGGGDRGVSPP